VCGSETSTDFDGGRATNVEWVDYDRCTDGDGCGDAAECGLSLRELAHNNRRDGIEKLNQVGREAVEQGRRNGSVRLIISCEDR
jgi:hypothetical protein